MISNAYANKILNFACGVENKLSTMPSLVYLGLSSTEPDTITGAVTGEPTAAAAPSYKRVVVGGSTAGVKYFDKADYGKIKNGMEIHFDTAKESYGNMKYFFLSDSANGVAFMWGKINDDEGVDIDVTNGEVVPVFYTGALEASIDVPLT